jgi:hypothetical protein
MPTGRPALHTPELEAEVLDRLSRMSMVKVCDMDDMPARSTIYLWMSEIEGFSNKYARACDERADHRAEMIDDIAERCLSGEVDPQAARVAIDAHKWTASKLKPKKYGDKVSTELSGPDGGPIKTDNKWSVEIVTTGKS